METIYVTKYALTTGIMEVKAIKCTNPHVSDMYKKADSFSQYYHKGDYELTKEAAVVKAEEMRIKKLKSLDKQMKKISALRF